MMAKLSPMEVLVNLLEEAIEEYKDNPCEKTMKHLTTACLMITLRETTKDKSLKETSQEAEETMLILSAFKSATNPQ